MWTDICYGRVKLARNQVWRKRRGQKLLVDVSFWVNDRVRPPYISGSYLRFELDGYEHRVYNPLGIPFDVNDLISRIKTVLGQAGGDVGGFEVVNVS